MHFNHIDIN